MFCDIIANAMKPYASHVCTKRCWGTVLHCACCLRCG